MTGLLGCTDELSAEGELARRDDAIVAGRETSDHPAVVEFVVGDERSDSGDPPTHVRMIGDGSMYTQSAHCGGRQDGVTRSSSSSSATKSRYAVTRATCSSRMVITQA